MGAACGGVLFFWIQGVLGSGQYGAMRESELEERKGSVDCC